MKAGARLEAASNLAAGPTRGPPPSVGETVSRRFDVGAWVYVALLEGFQLPSADVIVKVGRSNDLARREEQLNFGFPQPLGIRWRMLESWYVPDQMSAHHAEQAILRAEAKAGHSAGGEFLRIERAGLGALLKRCEAAATAGFDQTGPAAAARDRRRDSRADSTIRRAVDGKAAIPPPPLPRTRGSPARQRTPSHRRTGRTPQRRRRPRRASPPSS